jgi:hypothetical protein
MRRNEFLRKQITRITNFANRNSDFLTFQKLEFQKKNLTGIFGIGNRIGIPLPIGVPEIGTKNWDSQPRGVTVFKMSSLSDNIMNVITK